MGLKLNNDTIKSLLYESEIMPYILIKNRLFEEYAYNNENELENAVVNNKRYIFGSETVLIDYKRKVGPKDSKNTGIPDGFLIDFSDLKKPQLFFVEYELESHQLYDHIGPQIMRFYASFETAKGYLQKKLINVIKSDKKLNNEIELKLKNTSFDNIDSLLYDLIYEKNLGIIVVIDEQTEDLNVLFQRFSDKPEVIEVKKYQYNNELIYQYNPFREGISESIITTGKKKGELEEIDTIICPAREEGFKYAFIENDAWWKIRISPSMIPQLKHIAMYETYPVSEIKWIADIKEDGIKTYKNSGKYIVHVENKKKIKPITLDKDKKGIAPQSPRYTTYEKLKGAKKISDLW